MKSILVSVILSATALSASAVPAKPTPVKYVQPSGESVTVQLRGDERHHWYQSMDGYALVEDNKTLYYAEIDGRGRLVASSLPALEISRRSADVEAALAAMDKDAVLTALNMERALSPRVKSEEARAMRHPAKVKQGAAQSTPTVDDVYGKGLFSGDHYPVFGEQKGLVILVEYTDVKFNDPDVNYGGDVQTYYRDMLNGDNFTSHGGTGSARRWFLDNSDGQFQPTFDVYGPITLAHPMSYYGGNDFFGNDAHPEMMAVEACEQLDATVDFSQYDRDGNGYIDNAYIIYAGRGEASGGSADTVWPHSWDVSSAGVGTFVFDDKILDRYACSNEWEGSAPDGIGTFVHEFSHVLGLPDIYPTSYTEAFTPGDYCVMDYGNYNNDGRTPPNYGIFERNALGWMRPVLLSGDKVDQYTVRPIETMDGYVILTNRSDEFFLIENRQQTGWDKYIPGHGMIVWHIDYNSSVWTSNTVNNEKTHQCVDIVEADDIRTKESRAGDPFPGTKNVTDFTHRTCPAMKTWAGLELKVPLRNIREIDENIVFDGGYIPVPAPGEVTVYDVPEADITPSSFTVRWSLDPNTTYYLLNVYNEDHRVIWNNRNMGNSDVAVVTGLKPDNTYFVTITPCNEDADGHVSNEISVHTLPPTLDFLKTVALDATDVTSTSFTANWSPFDMATDYVVNVFRQDATPLQEVATDFAGGIGDLPQGWRTNAGGVTDDPALCGTAAPALYFTKKGYLLTSSMPEAIKKVRFHLAVVSPAPGAVLKVMGMSPGSYAWKEIDVIDLSDQNVLDYYSTAIPDQVNSLYLEYTAAGECAIAVDDIQIVYGGTVTSTSAHETYTDYHTGDVTSLTLENLEPDTQYEYNVQAFNATHHARVSDNIIVRTASANSAAVDEIYAGDADEDVRYYNLQGQPVTSPRKGQIYIRRTTTSSQKIVMP